MVRDRMLPVYIGWYRWSSPETSAAESAWKRRLWLEPHIARLKWWCEQVGAASWLGGCYWRGCGEVEISTEGERWDRTGTEQDRKRTWQGQSRRARARQEQKRGTEQDRDRADGDSVIVKGIPFSAVHFHFPIQPSRTPHVNINNWWSWKHWRGRTAQEMEERQIGPADLITLFLLQHMGGQPNIKEGSDTEWEGSWKMNCMMVTSPHLLWATEVKKQIHTHYGFFWGLHTDFWRRKSLCLDCCFQGSSEHFRSSWHHMSAALPMTSPWNHLPELSKADFSLSFFRFPFRPAFHFVPFNIFIITFQASVMFTI